MTDTTRSIERPSERHSERNSERGSALIAVLLLLMMMTALAAALSIGSQTESLISRNENAGAQAQAAAEAGLNHAVELAVTYIFEWKANGFGSVEEAVNMLLAGPDGDFATVEDNQSLGARDGIAAGEDIPLEVTAADRLSIGAAPQLRYTAIVTDDDASAPGAGGFVEDGDLTNDLNGRLIIRATGYVMGADGGEFSKVTLEATIAPFPLPAIVSNGDLELNGSVEIIGPSDPDAGAAVHTNSDLTISGNGGEVTGLVTATGEVDNGNDEISATSGAPRVNIPPVAAADYEVWADFKLRSDGTMLNLSTGAVCTWIKNTPCNSWDFNDASGEWSLGSNSATTGTYYVEGNAKISGSPGSKDNPVQISIIAEGNIVISGSPKLQPDTPELLFVTDKDLKITGNLDEAFTEEELISVQGQMLVHEQVDIGGSVTLAGQLVVEDAANTSNTVTSNSIHGGVSITYGGGLGGSSYSVVGWRDVRDAD